MGTSTSLLAPLAERMRPHTLEDYVGQQHLLQKGALLSNMIATGNLKSFILWGPPGVGKTTLASIIAETLGRDFITLSAINSGVKDVRDVIESAERGSMFRTAAPVLFIDEIHRFNKAQQDSLLGAVERGSIILIGATTENPSFEVINALLSRCQVFTLKPLEAADLDKLLQRAIREDEVLKHLDIEIEDSSALLHYSGGDGRKLLSVLEMLVTKAQSEGAKRIVINNEIVASILSAAPTTYDKNSEMHYDVISAFIKSVRGSDPNAAVYYMAKMLNGGEDPLFIARRLCILAAEDVGLANPNALLMANSCYQIVHAIGMPEARIPLSECAIYLACSPKSNSAYMAINNALELAKQTDTAPVPLHLRNAPTQLMSDLGYSDGYKYAHDYPGHFVDLEFMPAGLEGTVLYAPADNQREAMMNEAIKRNWKNKYNR